MEDRLPICKSAERLAFDYYLRTGRKRSPQPVEMKFNPYHDPRNGRFTFAPGNAGAASDHVVSRGRKPSLNDGANSDLQSSQTLTPKRSHTVFHPGENDPHLQSANNRIPRSGPIRPAPLPNPRAGRGGNNPPPDPLTLVELFPGIPDAPAGAIIAAVDNIFDISGPGRRLTTELANAEVNRLVAQLRSIDPRYRIDTLGFPETMQGQVNLIRSLRRERAALIYKVRGEIGPPQVETISFLQQQTNQAFAEAEVLLKAGKLPPSLSPRAAAGNYVDMSIRRATQNMFNQYGIDTSKSSEVRVVGREYDTSKEPNSYTIPDVRVGKLGIDVSLRRKTAGIRQVRGFFGSDFNPDHVAIIRPSQLGADTTYLLKPRR